jgi:hypothetical protein
MKITTVTSKPTKDMPEGLYKVVDVNGIYWGSYKVATTWTNERCVIEAWGDDLTTCHNSN